MAELYTKEADLINRSKRTLNDGTEKDSLTKLLLSCLSRGATGVLNLGRIFRRMHDDGIKTLNFEEFSRGIKESGLKCSDEDITKIFKRFEADESGTINLTEFLTAFRPELSPRRLSIIEQAFEKLDRTGNGVITVKDLKRVYSVQSHPGYKSGEISEEEIFNAFLSNFESVNSSDSAGITREEFVNYYSVVSASIDNDSYFDLMMRQRYQL